MTGFGIDHDFPDRTAEYQRRDLFKEGEWLLASRPSFGGVIFNRRSEILLREPKGFFGGYHWTFSKGRPDPGETPIETALRETLEETGRRPKVVGHVPGAFGGSTSSSYFYLMLDEDDTVDMRAMNDETSALQWIHPTEAPQLIEQTTIAIGRSRDLEILRASCTAFEQLRA